MNAPLVDVAVDGQDRMGRQGRLGRDVSRRQEVVPQVTAQIAHC